MSFFTFYYALKYTKPRHRTICRLCSQFALFPKYLTKQFQVTMSMHKIGKMSQFLENLVTSEQTDKPDFIDKAGSPITIQQELSILDAIGRVKPTKGTNKIISRI